MKKIITLMLVLPLLAGCGKNVKVKSPKFADMGSELEVDKFGEEFEKVMDESELAKEDLLPSSLFKSSSASVSKDEWTRGKNSIRTSKSGTKSESTTKIDMRNVIIASEGKSNTFLEAKTADSSSTDESKSKTNATVQEYKGEKYSHLAIVNQLDKTYYSVGAIPEDKDAKWQLDQYARGLMGSYTTTINSIIHYFPYMPEEEQAKYKFYQSDKVFTISYEEKVENEETKNLKDEVVYVTNSSKSIKYQLDLTDGKMSYKLYSKNEKKIEYKMEVESQDDIFAKGDVVTSSGEQATEVSYTHDDSVKASAVDLKGYTALSEFE